jgi:lysophospholipase L1-like esterase
LAIIGDSWSDGVNETADQVKAALEIRLGHSITLVNAALTGSRLDTMVARFDTDVLSHAPTTLIIQYGANDLSQGRSQALMEADIDAMIAKCRTNNIVPVFAGLPPIASVLATANARNDQMRARVDASL